MSKKPRVFLVFSALLLALSVLFALSLSTGDSRFSLKDPIVAMLGQADQSVHFIIFQARLPRILVSLLAGASLAQSGTLLQTLTRNPLADSSILGINAGAGFTVALLISLLNLTSPGTLAFLPLLSVLGGCAAVFLVYLTAQRRHQPINPVRLIISGVAVSSLISGLMIALVSTVDREKVAYIVEWLSGTYSGDDWDSIRLVAPLLILLWFLAYSRSSMLNIMTFGRQTAVGLGLHVKKERLLTLLLATGLAALSIILSGNISFIGLAASHISRRFLGTNHHLILPAASLIGAFILLAADTFVRVLMVGTGIPTGILVSLLGAPYFLYLLRGIK